MSVTTELGETPIELGLRLPPDPEAPGVARSVVRELHGLVPAELIEKLTLVSSELVTNALRHSRSDPEPTVSLRIDRDSIELAVSSVSPPFDRTAVKDLPGADGGFGLHLVDALADRWRVESDAVTRVVCEFDL
jgi:anti-sigma regulatory factor (Ser/Thr protein kinase)